MSNYDKCVEMLCLTGRMPLGLIDSLCNEAMRQINSAFEVAAAFSKSRDEELFGERKKFKDDYKSELFDYIEECEYNYE